MARVRHDDGRKGVEAAVDRGALDRRDRDEDAALAGSLRPRTMAEYIGQSALKRKLRVFVDAAKQRGEALDHVLLHGPPGLGKTTMAQILANELGVRIHITSGPAVEHKGILAGHLTALESGDVLFIDEIHRLTPAVEESLYSAMEDGRIDLPVGEGSRARTMPFALAPFTLVGATTRTALLGAPLRERFQIVEGLEYYADDELAAIVRRTAGILGVETSAEGAMEIGRRSRGTPRIANRLTRRVRDFAQVRERPRIELEDANFALGELGIDPEGLDAIDRRILTAIVDLFDGGPVGIEALAATLSEPRDTLEDVYEPFLLQRGFLIRTPRGRQVTRKALAHLGRTDAPPPSRGSGGPSGQGELPL
ncbi:MAG: Holliday junction branch migration DNA helicase RuvB [Deltaproteobacteria bacterium]|nr:Holliday junction branch migration DNA helicase RuvB [Deltaproteobacteria bacterium]MBK8237775.1 Holliday junction branch migration DNA helicase RuvB [Deltaproteobacteria bacterium]MBK8720146.1 Holliday junction branch migration DNA helicase RuvB [Deltaproteobacteria bacterium]MBP7289047.1 Holliday junction branch migration DNA helicase RuvB [Nannocystaceae bacterium]